MAAVNEAGDHRSGIAVHQTADRNQVSVGSAAHKTFDLSAGHDLQRRPA